MGMVANEAWKLANPGQGEFLFRNNVIFVVILWGGLTTNLIWCPILEIGNTNSRYKFSISARNFVNDWNSHGPAHHCAVGVGHIASKIKKLAQLLGIATIQVC